MDLNKICVIPGAFDPITNGHLDLIERACNLFDKIYVVAFENSTKKNMFNAEQRKEMLELACEDLNKLYDNKIIADCCIDELLADYANSKGAKFLVKGVRGTIDFEYEHDLYLINREIGDLETIFLPSKSENLFISSTFVREMIKYGRDINNYVPKRVAEYIKAKK